MSNLIFQFIDTAPPEAFTTLGAIIAIVIALALLLIGMGLLCYCGCFNRQNPQERAKKEGLEETGFSSMSKDQEESTKMLIEGK